MSITQYAYLLDQDNYIVENKIFIDLIWYITRTKDNGENKRKGIITKSYVIRNAGIMFQQIFYWHFNAIKNNKPTKYQYNDKGTSKNVVKMDFEDWWESVRLTDTEVSTANKLLIETGLITIHKMRIKVRDKDIYKPSNCYLLNIDLLEKYLEDIIKISKDMYKEKVASVREKNIESSLKHRNKILTELSTETSVTLETQVTLNLDGLQGDENTLSTISTEYFNENYPVTLETGVTKATPETEVTKATLETEVTKATLETGVANKSNTSSTNTSSTNTSSTDTKTTDTIPFYSINEYWVETSNILKTNLSDTQYNTWINSIAGVNIEDNILKLEVINRFSKEILETRYDRLIKDTFNLVTGKSYETKFWVNQ